MAGNTSQSDNDGVYKIAIIPSDSYFNNQWYLKKIKAIEAWDLKRESPEIVIAIIDTGVDITHPDLKDNIWINRNEIINNGTDDDKNGYVDDVNGWDFINNVADPSPKFKAGFTQDGILHGTVIAGIASASGNNAAGIAGVSWSSKIMSLKALDDKGEGNTGTVVKAINYAIDNGADIINLSFIGQNYSQSLEAAIATAYKNNIIIVAAAGNEQKDGVSNFLDTSPLYPVCYDGNNYENMVIGVTATDAMDQKTAFAGYSFKYVDLASPGVGIYSTAVYRPDKSTDQTSFNNLYDGYWSGTSMAVPMVSGAVALIESVNPYLTRKEVVDILFSTSDNINRLNPSFLGQLGKGRLNTENAVRAAKNMIENRLYNLAISPMSNNDSIIRITNESGILIKDIIAYDKFRGGVNVAAGDVDGDGKDELISAPGQGGGPHIKIMNKEGRVVQQFFAYAQNFRGGVNVAAGDVDGDGKDELITAPASGGGPHIKVFKANGTLKGQFMAYDKNFRGGVSLAVADIDRRVRIHRSEIITAPGKGLSPEIKIFNDNGKLLNKIMAFSQKFKSGVSITAIDSNNDGIDELAAAAGPGGAPHVRIFNPKGEIIESFYAFSENYSSGINIATLKNY